MKAKTRLSIPAALCGVLFLLAGCATWTRIEDPELKKAPDSRYAIEVPEGWVHAAFIKDGIVISKDGPGLNLIQVRDRKNAQAFVNTKVALTQDMLVSEVAEYFIAEYQATAGGTAVKHLSTEPADVGGLPGFKVRLEKTNASGLVFDVLAYGTKDDAYFYYLLYTAPRLYYYEKDVKDFEDLVASFRIQS
jgi:hypothetical protein